MAANVLLDTSFFIRLLKENDPLHQNARQYYQYFIESTIPMKISTISIAEYCVRGDIEELPLKTLQVIPFNINHAQKAGEFARILFDQKNQLEDQIKIRAIIPNDAKLFAQAELEKNITHYLTSDRRSEGMIQILKSRLKLNFDFIDMSIPVHQTFNQLF